MLISIASISLCIIFFLVLWMRSQATLSPLKASEMLIVAAHSDDCVIMGAEMAWGLLQDGGKVHIAYLTCSGQDPAAEISQVRAAEAQAAWQTIHKSSVSFFGADLPESPVQGPASYGDGDLERFQDLLEKKLNEMEEGAIVILSAPYESHVDHNNARNAGKSAIEAVNRDDLRVFETPEYNALLSMLHDPIGVIVTALAELPLLHRIMPKRSVSPAFLGGKIGATFRDTPERLEAKIEMLGAFESQDPDLLRRYFAWPSKYRRLGKSNYPYAFRLMGKTSDLSVVVFFVLVFMAVLFTTLSLSRVYLIGAVLAAILGACLALFAFKKRKLVPGVLAASLLPGAILGVLLSV